MLDKATSNVLSAVGEHCKDTNNYVIIKNEDIKPFLGKKNKLNDEGIGQSIHFLAERELIKLKYAEAGTYCLTMMPKGKLFEESKAEEKYLQKQENKRNRKFLIKIALASGFMAMIGAMIGVLLVNFILTW